MNPFVLTITDETQGGQNQSTNAEQWEIVNRLLV